MKTLIIMVGNIGSGKTTWIKKNRKKNQLIVSRDALRYMFGNGEYIFSSTTEPLVWEIEHGIVDKLFSMGKNVIVDGVGINKKLRQMYISSAKLYGYKVIIVEMPRYKMKRCVDNRMKNPHGQPDREIWEMVWNKFNNMYEKPKLSEGIYKIIKGSL